MNKFFVTMAPAVQSKLGIEGYVIEADDYRTRDGCIMFNTANDPDALITFSNVAIVSIEVVTDEDVEYVDEETFTPPTDPLQQILEMGSKIMNQASYTEEPQT